MDRRGPGNRRAPLGPGGAVRQDVALQLPHVPPRRLGARPAPDAGNVGTRTRRPRPPLPATPGRLRRGCRRGEAGPGETPAGGQGGMMPYTPVLATLGYVFSPDGAKVLMVHRNRRPNDPHLGKYNGLGGKLYADEDVLACMKREIREEAGI